MKVVILAGGLGTRLSEYTKTIPKPMVEIRGKPLIFYVMKNYARYGFKDFIIALGYKGNVVKNYFKKNSFGWNIKLINTGLKTMTGGRLKRLSKLLLDKTFLMTYGDGVSNVNIKKLIKFHKKNKKMITVTAVRPPARFGEITIKNKRVDTFKEKPQVKEGWINGGFFVANHEFFKFIKNDRTILENEPLEKATKVNQLYAYKHYGFWKCMDTLRDKEVLEKILKKEKNFY
mgnify:CR=1 FL=1